MDNEVAGFEVQSFPVLFKSGEDIARDLLVRKRKSR